MKSTIIPLLILVPLFGISQNKETATTEIYESEKKLKLITPIRWEHIKDGFSFGDGHVSYVFRLDSNNTFQFVESGCVAEIALDKGRWRIIKNKKLLLKSKNHKYSFDVIKFENFFFYIHPRQRLDFMKDLQRERNETAGYTTGADERRYTKEFFMAFHLLSKYYGNEIMD